MNAIAATPGVDAIWVGHNDLSVSLGVPGRFAHPPFVAAVEAVAHAHGKTAAVNAGHVKMALARMARGYRAIGLSTDVRLLAGSLRTRLAALRDSGR